MENIPTYEEYGILGIVLTVIVYVIVSFAAYLISIKGLYDIIPNIFKAGSAFLTDLAVNVLTYLAIYGILSSRVVESIADLDSVIFIALAVSAIVIIFVRKVTLQYASDVSTSLLQAITSIVMHSFYIFFIFVFIGLLLSLLFPGSFNPGTFTQ